MVNRILPEQIAVVRQYCQRVLSKKSLSTGIASTESHLLLEDVLWGMRFSMGCYHARWQLGKEVVLLFQDNQLLEKLEMGEVLVRKAA
jgi:hypothetical protein